MRRSVKGHALVLLCVVMLCLFLSGCTSLLLSFGGSGDWDFALPNGYEIIRINGYDIILGREMTESSSSYVIERYIVAFSYADSHVGICRLPIPEGTELQDIKQSLENAQSSDYLYYIVQTETDSILGPYTFEAYSDECRSLDKPELLHWTYTSDIHEDGAWDSHEPHQLQE